MVDQWSKYAIARLIQSVMDPWVKDRKNLTDIISVFLGHICDPCIKEEKAVFYDLRWQKAQVALSDPQEMETIKW